MMASARASCFSVLRRFGFRDPSRLFIASGKLLDPA